MWRRLIERKMAWQQLSEKTAWQQLAQRKKNAKWQLTKKRAWRKLSERTRSVTTTAKQGVTTATWTVKEVTTTAKQSVTATTWRKKRDNNCETTKCDSNYVKKESVTTTAKQDGVTTTTWRKKAWQQLRNKVWQQLCEERKRDNNCETRRCDNNYVKKESVTTAKRQGRRKRYFSISEVKPYKTHLLHEAATGRRVLWWCSKKKPLRHRQQLTGAAK